MYCVCEAVLREVCTGFVCRMFNRQLEDNPEQYAVIQRIVAGASKPAPYLVFGPPGTGKTITLVEAMTQVKDWIGLEWTNLGWARLDLSTVD